MNRHTIATLLLIVFVTIAPFYFLPRNIKITSITCTTQFGQCGNEFDYLKDLNGSLSIYKLKQTIVEKVNSNQLIEQSSIRYVFPQTLHLSIVKRVSRYGIKRENKSGIGLVDQEGRVVSIEDNVALPTLIVEKVPNVGEFVPSEYMFSLKMLYRFSRYYTVMDSKLNSDSFTISIKNQPRLVFPVGGDQALLAGSAVMILSRLKEEQENFRIESTDKVQEIDLRFKNPVLR